jgi:hypothetical protein
MANTRKCLDAGFDVVLSCPTTDGLREKLAAEAEGLGFPGKVHVLCARELTRLARVCDP